MNDIVSFDDWVRRRRKALDLTQATLASRVGCAVVTIKKIEQDQRRPSQTMARLLANQLEVPEADRENFVRMGRGEYVPELASPVTDILAESPRPEAPSLPSSLTTSVEAAPDQIHFVGREQELARLDSYLAFALAGQGRVIFVSGEAGRGKTTLLAEFAHRAQASHPNLVVANGNCNAFFGVGDPFLPFRDALSLLVGDLETSWLAGAISREQAQRLWHFAPLTIQAIAEQSPDLIGTLVPATTLLKQAATHFPENTTWLNQLQALGEAAANRSTQLVRRQLLEEASQLFFALATEKPLLLLLDDLQWADEASLSLLFHLGRRLASSRILVAGAYRTSEIASGRPAESGGIQQHPLRPVINEFKRNFGDIQVKLDHLEGAEERTFVNALLDSEPNRLSEAFRETLFHHTGGHPLFTVELLRHMQERGRLVRDESGYWVEAGGFNADRLPVAVEAVIQQRIDRLDETLQEILNIASVEGEEFSAQVIAQVTGMAVRQVLRHLSHELERQHRLVRESNEILLDHNLLNRYQFGHNLFQQFLYNRLSLGERRLLHGDIALALETVYRGHIDKIVSQLARHFREAGNLEQAVIYLERAGDQARQSAALVEATRYYRLAVDSLPDTEPARRADLLQKQGECLLVTGHTQEALNQVEAGYRLFEALGNTEQAGSMQRTIGRIFWELGDRERSLEHYNRALDILKQGPETVELARAISSLSQMHMLASEYEQSFALGQQALELAERLQADDVKAHALNNVGSSQMMSGDRDRGRAMLEESIRLAKALDLPHDACRAYINLAEQLATLGRFSEARALYEEVLAYASRYEAAMFAMLGLTELVRLDWISGEWAAALSRRQELIEWAKNDARYAGINTVVGGALSGWIYNDLGQIETARNILEKGLQTARNANELQTTAPYLGQLARTYALLGLEKEANAFLAEFVEMIDKFPDYFDQRSLHIALFACQWQATREPDNAERILRDLERADAQLGTVESAAVLSEGNGHLAAARKDDTTAADHFQQAAAGWAGLGRPYNQTRALSGLVRAYRRIGKTAEAGQALAAAQQLVDSLAAQLDDPALRTSFLNSEPARQINMDSGMTG